MECPYCGGKTRRKSQKAKGGHSIYKCGSCKRKYILDYSTGKLIQISI